MDVLMPQLGETVTEGTVSQWFKSVGDEIKAGEALFEIETDKTSMEVEATASGVLAEIRVEAGEAVPVGAAVAVIRSGDEPARPAAAAPEPAPAPSPQPAPARAEPPSPSRPATVSARRTLDPFREVATPEGSFGAARAANGLRITPVARRLARAQGVDLDELAVELARAGKSRIMRSDIETFTRPGKPSPAPVVSADGADVIELGRIRRTTAAHLAKSWAEVPHVYQAVEAGFHRVEKARRALDASTSAGGPKLTYLAFVARAVCLAIRSFPLINAHWGGDRLMVHRFVHLGIAVDLDHEGLVVPVIRHAEGLNVVGLARAIGEASGRARAGALTEDDLAGGTYTISNSGSFGTLMTTPIINQPQVAILSTDGVAKRPVVVKDDEGEHIAIRPAGIIGQSFDHRAFDGAYSAAYLRELKRIIETRDWLAEARAAV